MADPATYRTKEELEDWKKRDPIISLATKLDSLGMTAAREAIDKEVEDEIQDAVQFAESAPFPDPSTVSDYVYCDDTPLL